MKGNQEKFWNMKPNSRLIKSIVNEKGLDYYDTFIVGEDIIFIVYEIR